MVRGAAETALAAAPRLAAYAVRYGVKPLKRHRQLRAVYRAASNPVSPVWPVPTPERRVLSESLRDFLVPTPPRCTQLLGMKLHRHTCDRGAPAATLLRSSVAQISETKSSAAFSASLASTVDTPPTRPDHECVAQPATPRADASAAQPSGTRRLLTIGSSPTPCSQGQRGRLRCR